MRKVGIITLVKNAVDESFGPAMQIFAVQQILRDYGYAPETIIDETCKRSKIEQFRRGLDELGKGAGAVKFILRKAFTCSPRKASNGTNDKERELIGLRRENYSRFIKKYIHISDLKENELYIGNPKLAEYAFFAVGSDQVWNPYYPQKDEIKYLEFCEPQKRIPFVPSIARTDIPKRFQKGFIKGVSGFPKICIRENEGAELIRSLTGREAEVLIDPTLMISVEDYLKLTESFPSKPEKTYAFAYFMGVDTNYKEVEQVACRYADTCMWMRRFEFPDQYIMNPPQYIEAIRSAELVCTDSYHVTIFSILLRKPVIVFPKKEGTSFATSSRLTTLLKKFEMEYCIYLKNAVMDRVFNIDYSKVDRILEMERARAKIFFDDILGENK